MTAVRQARKGSSGLYVCTGSKAETPPKFGILAFDGMIEWQLILTYVEHEGGLFCQLIPRDVAKG